MAAPEPEGEQEPEILAWLRANEWLFAGIGSFATVFLVFVAWYQLSQTNKQLEATTLYAIQKDGRELLSQLQGDRELWDFFFNYKPPYSDEVQKRADREIAVVLQYYSSLSNQRRYGVISDRNWAVVEGEL
jgi:hypothetical protein